mgnify:CR=1 FL=1
MRSEWGGNSEDVQAGQQEDRAVYLHQLLWRDSVLSRHQKELQEGVHLVDLLVHHTEVTESRTKTYAQILSRTEDNALRAPRGG